MSRINLVLEVNTYRVRQGGHIHAHFNETNEDYYFLLKVELVLDLMEKGLLVLPIDYLLIFININ